MNRTLCRFSVSVATVTAAGLLSVPAATSQPAPACVADAPGAYTKLIGGEQRQWRGHVTFADVQASHLILFGFEKDSARLLSTHEEALDRLVETLDDNSVSEYSVTAIVGGASQTGPERENEALSRDRAETVRTYLEGEGLKVADPKYVGSSRPLIDLPGEECAHNRYVIVEFHTCADSRQPLNVAELKANLEDDLRLLKQQADIPEDEREVAPDLEIPILRCNYKSRYLLGRSYALLAQREEFEQLPLDPESPAYLAFGHAYEDEAGVYSKPAPGCFASPRQSVNAEVLLEREREIWLRRAWIRADKESSELLVNMFVTRGHALFVLWNLSRYQNEMPVEKELLEQHYRRCREDLAFRYTYCGTEEYQVDGQARYRWPEQWFREADESEKLVFGDVTNCRIDD